MLLGGGGKKKPALWAGVRARDGIRTRDPNLGKVVLYHLSYSREKRNERGPKKALKQGRMGERETGFEPATPTLARLCSTI